MLNNHIDMAKRKGSGEGIFALRCCSAQRSLDQIRCTFKIDTSYKFFFLQEWIVLGNIIEIV